MKYAVAYYILVFVWVLVYKKKGGVHSALPLSPPGTNLKLFNCQDYEARLTECDWQS